MTEPDRPLAGRTIVVTREQPGDLGRLLADRGATVLHLPLITVSDPADGGHALHVELGRLESYDWLVVTSPAGAERVGRSASASTVRLAAVGRSTADVLAGLAGRPVEAVPERQLASALAELLIERCDHPSRFLVAVADRAPDTLAASLVDAGHEVVSVDAYSTVFSVVGEATWRGADAVLFASGSAVEAWVDAFGVASPPCVAVIGPSTAATARRLGLKVSNVAADHSIEGLVKAVTSHFVDTAVQLGGDGPDGS